MRSILEILLKTHTQDKTLPLLIKLLRIENCESLHPDAIVKLLNAKLKPGELTDVKAKRDLEEAIYESKVARYLAYCVDGGLLQSKFTLSTLIQYAQSI